jgi:hypothetical protein
MAYLDRKRLIQSEDADAPDTTLGLEIPDALNPASPAYRYRKGPSLPAATEPVAPAAPSPALRKPAIQYSVTTGKPMIWRKGTVPPDPVRRTRDRLLRTPDFGGRFRDRAPIPNLAVPELEEWVEDPTANSRHLSGDLVEPVVPQTEDASTMWDEGREFFWEDMSGVEQDERLELLKQRPRTMNRDITEFESIQSLMEQTPGETRGTNEDMDSIVAPRLTRSHMRNQTPDYWPGSTDPSEHDPDWDPREAVVHPDRADNRRRRLITSRGAPSGLTRAMDNMFVEHTGEDNPFAGPEASKRIRK